MNNTGLGPTYFENDTIPATCATYSPMVNLLHQVLYTLVCVVGLCGNTLVIYVVLRFSKMQTVTNIYILNLAIADECFLFGIPFLVTTISLGSWIFGEYMCKLYMASTSINQFTSGLFLLIMSADRFLAVCHPINSRRFRTPLISRLVSLSAWLISVLFVIPILMYTSTTSFLERTTCNIYWPGADGPTTFTLYAFVLGFLVPLGFIVFFYYMVIRKLKNLGPKNKSEVKKRSNRKVTKLVLTIVTVYVLCWMPYWSTQIALIYADPYECQSALSYALFLLAGFLSYSNSAINPILYAFLSDNFKKSFAKACSCYAASLNRARDQEDPVKRQLVEGGKAQATGSGKAAVDSNSGANDRDGEAPDKVLLNSSSGTSSSKSNITLSSDSQNTSKEKSKNSEKIYERN